MLRKPIFRSKLFSYLNSQFPTNIFFRSMQNVLPRIELLAISMENLDFHEIHDTKAECGLH